MDGGWESKGSRAGGVGSPRAEGRRGSSEWYLPTTPEKKSGPGPRVVLTLGRKGSVWFDGDRGVKSFHRLPPPLPVDGYGPVPRPGVDVHPPKTGPCLYRSLDEGERVRSPVPQTHQSRS